MDAADPITIIIMVARSFIRVLHDARSRVSAQAACSFAIHLYSHRHDREKGSHVFAHSYGVRVMNYPPTYLTTSADHGTDNGWAVIAVLTSLSSRVTIGRSMRISHPLHFF